MRAEKVYKPAWYRCYREELVFELSYKKFLRINRDAEVLQFRAGYDGTVRYVDVKKAGESRQGVFTASDLSVYFGDADVVPYEVGTEDFSLSRCSAQ